MVIDVRLLIQHIPSLKGEKLCSFLQNMNDKEITKQKAERVIFDKAMADRDSYEWKAVISGVTGLFSSVGLVTSSVIAGSMIIVGKATIAGVMAKPIFVITVLALGVLAIGGIAGMIKYCDKAETVDVPKIYIPTSARLQTEIRQIKEKLHAENLDDDEKVQLPLALDALKGNRFLTPSYFRSLYIGD